MIIMYNFFSQWESRKRKNIFTDWNQCVSTRNKHLYNIYMYFFPFFCPFNFLRGQFVLKDCCNSTYITGLPCKEGTACGAF